MVGRGSDREIGFIIDLCIQSIEKSSKYNRHPIVIKTGYLLKFWHTNSKVKVRESTSRIVVSKKDHAKDIRVALKENCSLWKHR